MSGTTRSPSSTPPRVSFGRSSPSPREGAAGAGEVLEISTDTARDLSAESHALGRARGRRGRARPEPFRRRAKSARSSSCGGARASSPLRGSRPSALARTSLPGRRARPPARPPRSERRLTTVEPLTLLRAASSSPSGTRGAAPSRCSTAAPPIIRTPSPVEAPRAERRTSLASSPRRIGASRSAPSCE
jgi:hypothetical protein